MRENHNLDKKRTVIAIRSGCVDALVAALRLVSGNEEAVLNADLHSAVCTDTSIHSIKFRMNRFKSSEIPYDHSRENGTQRLVTRGT